MINNVRYTIFKDYYKNDENYTDSWVILYGTEKEATEAMNKFLSGEHVDKSWYDPEGNDYAGYDAVLYVDRVTL